MNEQEKHLQKLRLEQYDMLSRASSELTSALNMLSGLEAFTGDSSKVRNIRSITIETDLAERVVLEFPSVPVKGWAIRRAIEPELNELRKRIWEEMEKV
jgi:hypothetical protein